MKLTIPRKGFAEALALCGPVTKSRTPKEILKNVRLSTDGNRLVVSATDCEIWLQVQTDCTIHRPGIVLLPHALVQSLVRELRDETIELVETDNGACITTKDGEFNVPTEPATDYPAIPEAEGGSFNVPGPILAQMLRRTSYACDETSTRYPLGGVLFEPDGDKLRLVATDSRRLPVCEHAVKCSGPAFIPPKKACDLVQSMLSDTDGDCTITPGKATCKFDCGDVVLFSRKLEGRFPKWQDVVPKKCEHELRMSAESLTVAVRQAMLFTDPKTDIAVHFSIENGTATVSASATGKGKSSFPVETEATVHVNLDPRFILDALRDIEPGYVFTMRYNDTDSAIVLDVGCGTRCVVMPLRRE